MVGAEESIMAHGDIGSVTERGDGLGMVVGNQAVMDAGVCRVMVCRARGDSGAVTAFGEGLGMVVGIHAVVDAGARRVVVFRVV